MTHSSQIPFIILLNCRTCITEPNINNIHRPMIASCSCRTARPCRQWRVRAEPTSSVWAPRAIHFSRQSGSPPRTDLNVLKNQRSNNTTYSTFHVTPRNMKHKSNGLVGAVSVPELCRVTQTSQ